jgi:hypothetical protein
VAAVDLYTLAASLLAAAEEALSFTVRGTPARAYVSPGPPAFDCVEDQLTVHSAAVGELPTFAGFTGIDEGFRGHTRAAVIGPALVITALRCFSPINARGGPPTVAALEEQGQATLEDAWAIWNHITTLRHAGTLGELCNAMFRDGGVPIVQQGGVGGWQFVYRFQLDGGPL